MEHLEERKNAQSEFKAAVIIFRPLEKQYEQLEIFYKSFQKYCRYHNESS